jgi:hypothetical protein
MRFRVLFVQSSGETCSKSELWILYNSRAKAIYYINLPIFRQESINTNKVSFLSFKFKPKIGSSKNVSIVCSRNTFNHTFSVINALLNRSWFEGSTFWSILTRTSINFNGEKHSFPFCMLIWLKFECYRSFGVRFYHLRIMGQKDLGVSCQNI